MLSCLRDVKVKIFVSIILLMSACKPRGFNDSSVTQGDETLKGANAIAIHEAKKYELVYCEKGVQNATSELDCKKNSKKRVEMVQNDFQQMMSSFAWKSLLSNPYSSRMEVVSAELGNNFMRLKAFNDFNILPQYKLEFPKNAGLFIRSSHGIEYLNISYNYWHKTEDRLFSGDIKKLEPKDVYSELFAVKEFYQKNAEKIKNIIELRQNAFNTKGNPYIGDDNFAGEMLPLSSTSAGKPYNVFVRSYNKFVTALGEMDAIFNERLKSFDKLQAATKLAITRLQLPPDFVSFFKSFREFHNFSGKFNWHPLAGNSPFATPNKEYEYKLNKTDSFVFNSKTQKIYKNGKEFFSPKFDESAFEGLESRVLFLGSEFLYLSQENLWSVNLVTGAEDNTQLGQYFPASGYMSNKPRSYWTKYLLINQNYLILTHFNSSIVLKKETGKWTAAAEITDKEDLDPLAVRTGYLDRTNKNVCKRMNFNIYGCSSYTDFFPFYE